VAACCDQISQQDSKGHTKSFHKDVLWSKQGTRWTAHLGEEAMNHIITEPRQEISLNHNRTTDVAFVDILPVPNGRIEVVDVSETLGIRTTVLARFDEDGNLIGLTIENYRQFRREVMRKYLAFAVDRIIALLVDRVRSAFSRPTSPLALSGCAG
jgi:hypothetical protein